MRLLIVPSLLLAWGAAGSPVAAQTLTLREALGRADSAAYANRAAAGMARADASGATAALQGILPSLRAEGGWMRSNEPLTAFGMLLRQGAVTPADFAPDALNDPAPRNNWNGAVVVEQPLLNADAWAGRSAASHAADRATAQAQWTRTGTATDVVRAYYGAVLAAAQVTTLEAAARAAGAAVGMTRSMVEQGMVTRSDALLAEVRAGRVATQLAEARTGAEVARRRLALLLGDPASHPVLPDSLPADARIRSVAAAFIPPATDSVTRADVRAALAGEAAARGDATRADLTLMPRLNAFGRLDWNDPEAVWDASSRWTVGVMVSWSPFRGGADVADRAAAAGRAEAARAMAEAAAEQARLEAWAAGQEHAVSLERLANAASAVEQGTEAHRLVRRKYDGGLATVVELLAAEAAETESRLAHADARWRAIVADAERRRALGAPLDELTALEDTP